MSRKERLATRNPLLERQYWLSRRAFLRTMALAGSATAVAAMLPDHQRQKDAISQDWNRRRCSHHKGRAKDVRCSIELLLRQPVPVSLVVRRRWVGIDITGAAPSSSARDQFIGQANCTRKRIRFAAIDVEAECVLLPACHPIYQHDIVAIGRLEANQTNSIRG